MRHRTILIATMAVLIGGFSAAQAQVLFWDIDGDANAGAGGATPTGTWNAANTLWGNSAGTAAGVAWVPGNTAVFAAGTDATGVYTVTLSGTQTVSGLTLEEGAVTLSAGTIALNNGSAINVASGTGLSLSISSNLTNAAGETVTKTGSGTLTLSGGNSGLNGEFILSSGTIGIGGNQIFGQSSNTTAQFTINGGTIGSNNTNGRTVQVNKYNIAGSYTVDSGTVAGIANPGNIDFNGSSASAIITLTTTPTITVISPTNTANGFMIFNGTVTEDSSSRGIIKDGSGVLTLNNANNSYTGSTTILNGQLRIDGDGKLGTGAGTLFLSGGKLNTSASRTPSSDPVSNPIVVTADSSITTTSAAANVDLNLSNDSISGTGGTLTFRNEAAAGTGVFQPRFTGSGFDFTRPIDLATGLNDANRGTQLNSYNATGTTQTFSGVISGVGSYVRNASTVGSGGTTIFTAANTYSGGTSVSRGTLIVNNTSGSGTGSGAVTVGGNGILGGTGSVAGLITVNNFGIVAPGQSIGTLTANGGLTLDAKVAMTDPGARLSLELGAPGTNDKINVTNTGGLTINGGTVNLFDAGGLAAGTYTLIDYVGALGGAFSNLELGLTQPAGFSYELVDNMSNTSIDLQVSIGGAGVPGDYNGNGVVDGADYVIWRKNNGLMGGATASQGDGTGDGNVDSADFTYWRDRFGNTSGSGSGRVGAGAVPEPGTLALLLMAGLAAAWTRRHR